MNITMFLMIHLCVKVRRNNNIMRARERVFSGNDKHEFDVDSSGLEDERSFKAFELPKFLKTFFKHLAEEAYFFAGRIIS